MSQKSILLSLLSDGRPHSNYEIHERTAMLRYSARILDLKALGYEIETKRDLDDPQKFWFQLLPGEKSGSHSAQSPSLKKLEAAPGLFRETNIYGEMFYS